MRTRGDSYGEHDAAMRWLEEHDPDATNPGYAKRHGLIGRALARQIKRREVSLAYIEDVERRREDAPVA